MRYHLFSLLLLIFFSCKKNKEEEPKCKFKSINRAGFQYAVSYQGDTVMIVGEGTSGYRMYFSPSGRVQRIEEPAANPYIRSNLVYDNTGKITERTGYYKEGSNWVYKWKLLFTYTNNKITNIREESTFNTSGTIYDYDLAWEGDNVRSVTSRIGSDILCTRQYSYDGSKTNPMTSYSYLYFGDGDANYAGYKLPFYFSKNLVTKEESNCPLTEGRTFSYTFTTNGLIENVYDRGAGLWEYEYYCK